MPVTNNASDYSPVQFNVQTGGTLGTLNQVAPGATVGQALVSAGAAAQPAFGTVTVPGGGTGDVSFTAYAVIAGGTTSTGPLQSVASVGTAGQVLTSQGPGALPTFQTNAATTVWNDITGTSATMVPNEGYLADNAALVTLTLPATAAQFTYLRVAGFGAGGWLVAQNAGQSIQFGSGVATTTGVSGSLASNNRYDVVELLCVAADTTWLVLSSVGNLSIT